MKIIITEDQLKTAVFQNAVDMAWEDIADNIKEEDYYTDGGYGDNYEAVTKVEVVNAYKTESNTLKGVKIIELAIIIYINTIIYKKRGKHSVCPFLVCMIPEEFYYECFNFF